MHTIPPYALPSYTEGRAPPPTPGSELEQGVERRAGVLGGLAVVLAAGLRGFLGGEEGALVARALLGDARRDLLELAALPAHRGVEVEAVGAGVEVGVALAARRVDLDGVGDRPLGAAPGAAEDRRGGPAEAAAPRTFLLLARPLLRSAALSRGVVLVSALPVSAFGHGKDSTAKLHPRG